MFLCRCRRSTVGGMGFLKLISQAFPRPLPQSPLVFFPLFRPLYFSLALYYLNAWNRLHQMKTSSNQTGLCSLTVRPKLLSCEKLPYTLNYHRKFSVSWWKRWTTIQIEVVLLNAFQKRCFWKQKVDLWTFASHVIKVSFWVVASR